MNASAMSTKVHSDMNPTEHDSSAGCWHYRMLNDCGAIRDQLDQVLKRLRQLETFPRPRGSARGRTAPQALPAFNAADEKIQSQLAR